VWGDVKGVIFDVPKGCGLRGADGIIDEKIQYHEDQKWKILASIETNCGGAIKRGDSRNTRRVDPHAYEREKRNKYVMKWGLFTAVAKAQSSICQESVKAVCFSVPHSYTTSPSIIRVCILFDCFCFSMLRYTGHSLWLVSVLPHKSTSW
jgi:hypothetical protein